MANKTPEYRLKANREHDKRYPEQAKYRRYRSNAKVFITKMASKDEIVWLKGLADERLVTLKKEEKQDDSI